MILPQKPTVTLTVRLNKNIVYELQEISKSHGSSLNSTINHILSQDTSWHLFAAAAGFLYFPRMLVSDIACKLTEQEILENAHKYVSEEMRDAIIIIRKNFDFRQTLEVFRLWMENSGIPYRYEAIGHNHICILGLRLGRKGSLLVGEIAASVFKILQVRDVAYDITPNALILRVEE